MLSVYVLDRDGFRSRYGGEPGYVDMAHRLWHHHYQLPLDTIPNDGDRFVSKLRELFFGGQWFEFYDLIEFIVAIPDCGELVAPVNDVLEADMASVRIVGGRLVEVTDQREVDEITEALDDAAFPAVATHFTAALALLGNRPDPDYRNSVKESISAVEAMARAITGLPKATLGDALKVAEKKKSLHPALREAFSRLYGYASDEGGIRHAMSEGPSVSAGEAKLMLVLCASFVNYLKTLSAR